MMNYSNDLKVICPIHNLKPEFFSPIKNNPNRIFACQQCILQYYGLITQSPIQKLDEQQKVFSKQYQTQFPLNSQESDVEKIIKKVKLQDDHINYEYQLLPQSKIKESLCCRDIAFNKDASIVVAGDMFDIKVFEFKDKILKQIQLIKGHQSFIMCLQFMRKSDQFISGCFEGLIKIWSQNNQKEWINTQTLIGHSKKIKFLIINSNEDLIISGGDDHLIKFWSLKNNQWTLNQKMKFKDLGSYASLNNSNTKLIFSKHCCIQILEQQRNGWIATQRINGRHENSKLLFINDNEFVVQPFVCKQLKFYTLNQINNLFEFGYEVEVPENQYHDHEGFPINFVKYKKILIAKNGNYVNILRKQRNGLFFLEQQIEFYNERFSGRVSDDGQFIIFWDSQNDEFQIRILNEIK